MKNCDNCGAPLTLVEGRGYFYCVYCTTFHFPTDLESSADGVTSLGQEHDAECPICKVALFAGTIEGRRAMYCEKCRGVLLPSDDFGKIVMARRSKYVDQDADPIPLNPEDLKRKVPCPMCGNLMDAHPYYGPGAVVVDSCGRCRMVWLDHGEIAAIERAPGHR